MAGDNVKIIIQEDDTTYPLGAGTSSDIVFVPGFSSKFNAVKDTPVLCNTVAEFEKHFGKAPKYLTENDVEGFTDYGYRSGDYDRSYIYAKELLNQGMSVIYANLDKRETSDVQPETATIKLRTPKTGVNGVPGLSADIDSSTVVLTATNQVIKDEFILNCSMSESLKIAAAQEGEPTKTFFEFGPSVEIIDSAVNSLKIIDFSADALIIDPETTGISKIATSENVIGFVNTSDKEVDVQVTFALTIRPDNFGSGNDVTTANLTIKLFSGSLIGSFYSGISSLYELLADRSEYSVKYITSGGYPAAVKSNTGIDDKCGTKMIQCAYDRGDAVALVDYMMDNTKVLWGSDSVYDGMQACYQSLGDKASYGAAFYPWGIYNCSTTLSDYPDNMNVLMPASFGYMMCLATAIKTSPNWLAMAGVTRGLVPNLKSLYTQGTLTNVVAENYQPRFGSDGNTVSINAITNVRPYGLTMWGNRTLLPVDPKGTKALNFLNTRNMVSDIKKVLYTTAKSLMFEQDSDTLWLKFKSGVTPLLNQLVGGNGISDYKIIRTNTKYNGAPLTRGEMAATIKIFPLYAIEYFELTVQISDQDVTVE